MNVIEIPIRQASRKRKHASQGDVRHTETQSHKRHKNHIKGDPADPLTYLNNDTVDIILSYIPSLDIVRCERVSRKWQARVKSWMETFGIRMRFRHSWNSATTISAYGTFKQAARQLHSIQAGKPLSVYQISDVNKIVFAGNYVAWSSNSKPLLTSNLVSSDRVIWQCLARSEVGTMEEAKTFPATQFFRPQGKPVCVNHLAMNSEGILLLQLDPDGYLSPSSVGRNLVYSPVEKKVLWRQDYEQDLREHGRPSSLLIGKRLVYLAVKQKDGYKIEAYDFRTKELLYQSPTHHRFWANDHSTSFHRLFRQKLTFFKLFVASGGEEYILELSSEAREENPTISVISGANGQSVRTINFPESQLNAFIPHSTGSCIAFVAPAQLIPTPFVGFLRTHRIAIIRRFSCRPGNFLSTLFADVIFSPRELVSEPDRLYKPMVAIHPFSCAAISSFCPSSPSSYPPWNVQGHSLEPTKEERFHEVAKAVLQQCFPNDTPPLNDCLVLTKGNMATLPPRPEIGRNNRVKLVLPKGYVTWKIQFINEGIASVRHGDQEYLLIF